MKLLNMVLVCLLVAAMWLQNVDSKSMHVVSSRCCLNTLENKIALKFIKCYKEIGPSCPYYPAVIFRLIKGRESCALTNTTWVQDYLKKVKPC
ncbi:C-C motif chemokine 1 precursor [Rattus norvegicus]|uniref:C-C motif chemokine n=2 Tax=Rattus norvegicus TaxID=10116 RepID=D3ZDY4_RAT|nr:C-C motif chemokine 1 precursor [Rattus norvegicus]|eukprot:NP_001178021.1 C-C motif chemokine 1 precursor [Rattus norvegicus]